MVVAALVAAGGLVLARKRSDAYARKEDDRAAQRGLPAVPENDIGEVSDNGCSFSEHGRAVEREYTERLRLSPTRATIDDELSPPYSVGSAESSRSLEYHSTSSNGTLSLSSRHRSSSLSSSSTSSDAQGVRVRTKGDDLKSGFPYHPGLFDLRVRPDDWERFSGQVTDATRFSSGDYAKMWAAAGSVALTGSVLTTVWVGRTINRSIQDKKVSTGLTDTSEGSLGDVLERWNQSYFAPLGLCARLELSESALRKPKQKSTIIRRPSLTYNSREERERKNEDRKFVIVVAELVNNETPTGVYELVCEPDKTEMPVPGDPRRYTSELPGDAMLHPAELPNNGEEAKEDLADIICGIAELPADVPIELPAGSVEKKRLDDTMKTA